MASNKGVGSASAPLDDSDLEDLIAKSPRGIPKSTVEIESGRGGGGGFLSVTPLGFIAGSCRLFCYQCPRLSKCILSLIAVALIALLTNYVFNPTKEIGVMGADYSAITSAYDLSLSKVDHWCIQGDNDSCKCENPLEPNSRSEFKSWNAAHKSNVADVNMYRAVWGSEPSLEDEATGKPRPPIDVAFLGESVVEAMDGRWLGKKIVKALDEKGQVGPEAKRKPDIGKSFEKMFRKDKGGPVEGVALGIAGDNTANVLWRLQHDEMPYDFNPKVWWLVLGMNDLTRMQCSEEIVVLGILRVVEEIRLRKPDAHIVINSLLPMVSYMPMDQKMKMADFADFKTDPGFAAREGMEVEKAKKQFAEKEEGHRQLRSPRSPRKGRRDRPHRDGDDDAKKGAALEEAMERRKKILEKRDKRIRDRPFRDQEKYHPKRPLSPLLPLIKKRNLPPVWPSVHVINDKLKKFCEKHDSITFFDATGIFASNEGGGRHQLRSELISPRGHPSELGFAVWEGNIMGRLHQLLKEKQKKRVEPIPMPIEDRGEDAEDYDDEDVDDDEVEDAADEPHSEIEEISPVTKVEDAGADLVEGEDAEVEDGVEHVSEGKESKPPKKAKQPSRSEPADEAKEEDKNDVEEEEGENGDDKKEEEDDDNDNEAGDEDEEEEGEEEDDDEKDNDEEEEE